MFLDNNNNVKKYVYCAVDDICRSRFSVIYIGESNGDLRLCYVLRHSLVAAQMTNKVLQAPKNTTISSYPILFFIPLARYPRSVQNNIF